MASTRTPGPTATITPHVPIGISKLYIKEEKERRRGERRERRREGGRGGRREEEGGRIGSQLWESR